jgi:H+-transporting ATPase
MGLTSVEAKRRLEQYGPNEIPERRPLLIVRLLKKFWGPIPWMLEATIAVQILLGKDQRSHQLLRGRQGQ